MKANHNSTGKYLAWLTIIYAIKSGNVNLNTKKTTLGMNTDKNDAWAAVIKV